MPFIRALVLLVLLAVPVVAIPGDAEEDKACEGSPSDAVMGLPAPVNRWGGIFCTPYGHVVASLPGWIWTQPGAYAPVFIPSQMVRDNPQPVGNTSYFTAISAVRIEGAEYDEALGAMLPGVREEGRPEGYRLDLTSVSGRKLKIVFFDYGHHAWAIWCRETCDPMSIFMLLNITEPAPDKHNE
ncbi:MAG: hypothetical protein WD034_05920 [Parvibaculum sp.]